MRTTATVKTLAALTLTTVGLTVAGPGIADDRNSLPVAGWAPYWANSSADGATNSTVLKEVLPFWYTVKMSQGKPYVTAQLSQSSIDTYTKKWKNKNLKLLASVTDSTGARKMAGILSNKSSRTAHIADLVNLAKNYDGIDLDYETFAFSDGSSTWPTTQLAWIKFISELSVKLHEQNKLLSVTTPPMYSDTSGYWVYAHKAILPKVDYLRIMAYDYSVGSAGPIAPINWVSSLLNYELSINKEYNHKIWLGIPAYGRSWAKSDCPSGVGADTYTKSFTTQSAPSGVENKTYKEHTATTTSTHSWTTAKNKQKTCQITRTSWWLTDEDIAARVELAQRKGAGGAVLWTLGGHSNNLWNILADQNRADRKKVKVQVSVKKRKKGHSLLVRTVPAKAALVVKTVKPATSTKTGGDGTVKIKLGKLPKKVCVYTPEKTCVSNY